MSANLMTSKEVAAMLQLTPGTLANWRCKGTGPRYCEAGPGNVRYRLADVEAWLVASVEETRRAATTKTDAT